MRATIPLMAVAMMCAPHLAYAQGGGSAPVIRVAGETALATAATTMGLVAFLTMRYRVEPIYTKPGPMEIVMSSAIVVGGVVAGLTIGERGNYREAAFGAGLGALGGGALFAAVAHAGGWSDDGKFAAALFGAAAGTVAGFLIGGLALERQDVQVDPASISVRRPVGVRIRF